VAVLNEILVGRFNRFLQKWLSMKGPASMNTLSPELVATVPVFHAAEDRYLEGWARFGLVLQQPAGGAGAFSKFSLRNPTGSNVVAVVEKIRVIASTAATFVLADLSIAPGGADLATIPGTANTRFDARGPQQSVCVPSRDANAVAVVGVIIDEQVLDTAAGGLSAVDYIITDIQELPLLPGDAYRVQLNTAVLAANLVLQWRERFLEDSERA